MSNGSDLQLYSTSKIKPWNTSLYIGVIIYKNDAHPVICESCSIKVQCTTLQYIKDKTMEYIIVHHYLQKRCSSSHVWELIFNSHVEYTDIACSFH